MGFRFRFETVLRQRQRVVDEIAGRLGRAQRLVRQEEETLAVLDEANRSYRERYAAALAAPELDVARLQRGVRYAEFLDRATVEQRERIREMERRTEQIRALLVEAERAKQVFQHLKDRRRDQFYRDLAARERAYFDGVANTIFTAKHQANAVVREG